MGIFTFMNGRKKPTPGELAKERLKVVLVQDRLKLNPELLELIRADLMAAISRRLEIDEQHVEVSLGREDRWINSTPMSPLNARKFLSNGTHQPIHPRLKSCKAKPSTSKSKESMKNNSPLTKMLSLGRLNIFVRGLFLPPEYTCIWIFSIY